MPRPRATLLKRRKYRHICKLPPAGCFCTLTPRPPPIAPPQRSHAHLGKSQTLRAVPASPQLASDYPLQHQRVFSHLFFFFCAPAGAHGPRCVLLLQRVLALPCSVSVAADGSVSGHLCASKRPRPQAALVTMPHLLFRRLRSVVKPSVLPSCNADVKKFNTWADNNNRKCEGNHRSK